MLPLRKRIKLSLLVHTALFIFGLSTISVWASEPITVALILAETGIAADDNRPAINAARLAAEEINASGGLLGRPLRMLLIDNFSTPLGAKRAAEKALAMKVSAVIGAIWSSHSLPMAQLFQNKKMPMISPTATDPKVTGTGDYIFRACFSDAFQGRVMAHFAYRDLGFRTACALINSNEEYSLTLAQFFTDCFTQINGKILWRGNYKGTAVDFSTLLTALKRASPDVVFLPGYSRDSGLIIRQAANMGIKTTFLGGDGWGNKIHDFAGDALEGCYYSTHWHPEAPFPENKHLLAKYLKNYGIRQFTDIRIPLTYDAMMLLADAVRRAGSIKRAAIRDSLAGTKNFRGATGTITFDKNGDPMNKEASIIKFSGGFANFVKSVKP